MKIVEFEQNDRVGYYDELNDVVVLNEKLKQFPRLYKFILDHEINHALKRTNYLYHLEHDLKDCKRLYSEFRQDWKEFKKVQHKSDFKKDWKYYLFALFYNTIFQLILFVYIEYYYFKREKL